MKNIYLIFFFALFGIFNASGQGSPTPIGAKNTSLEVLGGIKLDSGLQLPFLTNAQAKFTKGGLDTNGRLFASTTDTLPRYMKKGVIVHSLTQFDSGILYATPYDVAHATFDTTSLSNRINQRVKYSDSVTIYVTPYDNDTGKVRLSSAIVGKQNFTDTGTYDATKANLNTAIALRIPYTDTGSLITTFYDVDTAKRRITTDLNTKQPYSDTSTSDATRFWVLSQGYGTSTDTTALSNRINQRVKYSDSVTIYVTPYDNDTGKLRITTAVNTKQNFSDTATWDATKANLNTGLALKINYSDTGSVLYSKYGVDTAKSAIRTAIPSTSGFIPYTGATSNVDLGTKNLSADTTNINTPTSTGAALNVRGNILAVTNSATPITLTNPLADFEASVNAVVQISIRNASAGAGASSDLVVTGDNGTDATHYVDLGVNSSGFSDAAWTINGAGDAYLYEQSDNFSIGTASNKYISIFTGGTLAANERLKIDGAGTMTVSATSIFNSDITVNGIPIGKGASSVVSNTRVGISALSAVTSGINQTAFGTGALAAITSATAGNTGLGANAGSKITTGINDVFIGSNSGANTSTGLSSCTGIGQLTLNFTTGDNNTAIGNSNMAKGSSWNGISNTGVGSNMFNALTSGSTNCGVGANTLNAVTSGGSNVAFGALALNSITTVNQCTAVGVSALTLATGAVNTAIGYNAGSAVTTGAKNVFVGGFTGVSFITSSNNIWLSDMDGNVRGRIPSTGSWLIGSNTDNTNGILQLTGSLALETAGNKILIATGTNASASTTATLSSGTVTISTTAVTALSLIQVNYAPAGISIGVGNVSTAFYISTITAGTSFVIQALTLAGIVNTTDNSTVTWWFVN